MHFAAECVEHCNYFRSTWGILSDPAHLSAELVIEAVTGFFGWVIGSRQYRKWLRKHDKEVHGHDHPGD